MKVQLGRRGERYYLRRMGGCHLLEGSGRCWMAREKVYTAFRVPPLPPQYCPLSSDGSLGLLALAVNQPKAGLSRELFFPQLVRLRLGLLMVVWNRPGSQNTDWAGHGSPPSGSGGAHGIKTKQQSGAGTGSSDAKVDGLQRY